jgi:hypothetical protein
MVIIYITCMYIESCRTSNRVFSLSFNLLTLTRVFSTTTNRDSNLRSKNHSSYRYYPIIKKKINYRSAIAIYKMPESILCDRIASRPPRAETRPNRTKLNEIEEDIIVRYIFRLDAQGFAPRLASVKDIANLLLRSRGQNPIGTR